MSVAGISLVKDEVDVIQKTVEHMLGQVDQIYVADNGSTDGTREILEGLPVTLLDDAEVGYYQSEKMTELAERAGGEGADWVVPFDADEIWQARQGRIGDVLLALPSDILVAEAEIYDHVASPEGLDWRRSEPAPLMKVACRALEGLKIHQGNHAASFDFEPEPIVVKGKLRIHHFPYRSAEQMIRKARNGAAAYAATDLPMDVGAHWRAYGRLSDEQIREVFAEYFFEDDPEGAGLVLEPA